MTVENDVNGATKVLAADSLASSQGDTANGTSHTGQVYEVGLAGSAFQELSDIDWNDLRPGDVVRIHWREEAYNERILLNAQGTEENPIVIEGVPGPNGELPVLDADGATTDDQFSNYGEVFRQNLGGSFFIGTPSSFPSDDEIPQNITIRGLEITGAGQGNTFTGTDGVEHDREFTAGIYVKGGVNITIEDNYIHHNGNGVFSSSQHEFEITENLVIRGNTFENNGVEGRFTDHHTYTEGLNTLIEHNTFGPKLNGDFGSLVKSRDVGLTIRNNEFGSAPGHFIDIGNIEADALIAGGYHQTDAYLHGSFVYENNIVASTGSIFFGGDTFGKDRGTGLGYDYRQTLEFHDNNVTYIADREDAYRVEILRAPNIEQTFNLSGNTFETLTETPGAAVPFFGLISSNGDPSVNFTGTNYFSPTLSLFNDRGPGDGIITGFDENVEFLEVDEREVETPVDQDPTNGGEAPSAGDEGEGDGDGIVRTGTDASDVFTATSGDDTLEGLGGNDFLYGYEGDDLIVGGDGDDLIAGNEGNDILIGGRGNDQLFGDSGADIFVFTSESYGNGSDTIKAFSVEDGDRLDFSELLQAFNPETDDLSDFIRISVEDLYHTVIAVDVDGGGDGFVDVVTLSYNTDYDLKALVESQALVLPTNVDTGPTETQDGDGDGIVRTGTDASDVFTEVPLIS